MSRHFIITQLAAAGAAAAIIAAPAAAQDLRSPDARDAARATTATAQVPRDLRSPDTRDAALGRTTSNTPAPIFIESRKSTSGFAWDDAGIGAGAILVLVALGGTGMVLIHRRRVARPNLPPTHA
jgi:hypothetical protein